MKTRTLTRSIFAALLAVFAVATFTGTSAAVPYPLEELAGFQEEYAGIRNGYQEGTSSLADLAELQAKISTWRVSLTALRFQMPWFAAVTPMPQLVHPTISNNTIDTARRIDSRY